MEDTNIKRYNYNEELDKKMERFRLLLLNSELDFSLCEISCRINIESKLAKHIINDSNSTSPKIVELFETEFGCPKDGYVVVQLLIPQPQPQSLRGHEYIIKWLNDNNSYN